MPWSRRASVGSPVGSPGHRSGGRLGQQLTDWLIKVIDWIWVWFFYVLLFFVVSPNAADNGNVYTVPGYTSSHIRINIHIDSGSHQNNHVKDLQAKQMCHESHAMVYSPFTNKNMIRLFEGWANLTISS